MVAAKPLTGDEISNLVLAVLVIVAWVVFVRVLIRGATHPPATTPVDLRIERVARKAYEVNVAYHAMAYRNNHRPTWKQLPEEKRAHIRRVVVAIDRGEITTPAERHEYWRRERIATGWSYGPVKDIERQQHPELVPFDDLPTRQQMEVFVCFHAIRDYLREHAS